MAVLKLLRRLLGSEFKLYWIWL